MIIFLYGEDSFRSSEKLAEIKNKFLINNNSGSDLSVIDFEEDSNKRLEDVVNSISLFTSKQLVISKNLIKKANKDVQDESLEFLENRKGIIRSKDSVVVFWEEGIPRKNSKLFKFIGKNSKIQNFEKLKAGQLEKWVVSQFAKINPEVEISKSALNKLISFVSDDLFMLDNEIKKLTNFKSDGIIGEKDVEILVKAKIESNIFETIEALSSGDKKTALKMLHNQLTFGEDPFYILSMYIYQFRNLIKISEFSLGGSGNQYQIAKEIGLHPFVIQKGLSQLRGITIQRLKEIYQKLKILDINVKTGKHEIKLALDKFVAEC